MLRQLIMLAAVALCATAANAQFQARDINGDGSIDAYYDTAHDLTWAADANLYATRGGAPQPNPNAWMPGAPAFLPPGMLLQGAAASWAGSLVIAGLDGWRLPSRLIPDGIDPQTGCPFRVCGQVSNRWTSELSFMQGLLNGGSGPFLNVMRGDYMTYDSDLRWFELRNLYTGVGGITDEDGLRAGYAWAMRSGDVTVAAVPEPETYALMALGLGALGWQVRRRRPQTGPQTAVTGA